MLSGNNEQLNEKYYVPGDIVYYFDYSKGKVVKTEIVATYLFKQAVKYLIFGKSSNEPFFHDQLFDSIEGIFKKMQSDVLDNTSSGG